MGKVEKNNSQQVNTLKKEEVFKEIWEYICQRKILPAQMLLVADRKNIGQFILHISWEEEKKSYPISNMGTLKKYIFQERAFFWESFKKIENQTDFFTALLTQDTAKDIVDIFEYYASSVLSVLVDNNISPNKKKVFASSGLWWKIAAIESITLKKKLIELSNRVNIYKLNLLLRESFIPIVQEKNISELAYIVDKVDITRMSEKLLEPNSLLLLFDILSESELVTLVNAGNSEKFIKLFQNVSERSWKDFFQEISLLDALCIINEVSVEYVSIFLQKCPKDFFLFINEPWLDIKEKIETSDLSDKKSFFQIIKNNNAHDISSLISLTWTEKFSHMLNINKDNIVAISKLIQAWHTEELARIILQIDSFTLSEIFSRTPAEYIQGFLSETETRAWLVQFIKEVEDIEKVYDILSMVDPSKFSIYLQPKYIQDSIHQINSMERDMLSGMIERMNQAKRMWGSLSWFKETAYL